MTDRRKTPANPTRRSADEGMSVASEGMYAADEGTSVAAASQAAVTQGETPAEASAEPADLLSALRGGETAGVDRARARLASKAAEAGALDVAFRTLQSPLGPLLLAATDRGLVRVAFANDDHQAVLAALAASVSPRVLHAPKRLDPVAAQLDQYFAGKRRRFELHLDLQLARGFRREVLVKLVDIAYGATASYGAIAVAAGRPKAVRAVGTACAQNPLPLVLPCHRVLRSDGSLGGYGGGLDAKRMLLALESEG